MSETTASSSATADGLTYRTAARTDKGVQRSTNEDAFALPTLPGVDLAFIVADGMGGLQAGEIASQEAVRVLEESLRTSLVGGAEPPAALADALTRANAAVYSLTRDLLRAASEGDEPTQRPGQSPAPQNAVMGTTAVVGLVRGGTLYLAHAGDSRAYLFRDDELIPLTEDHSFVAERVRAGDMTAAEARVSRFRNMITRAVGIDAQVQPEFAEEPLQPGDTILTCSDGLTTMLDDAEIEEMLGASPLARATPERVASALVDAANKRGGSDNITVVVLRVDGVRTGATANGRGGTAPTRAAADPAASGVSVLPSAATAAASRRAETRPAATRASGASGTRGRNVIDIDARRRGTSPFVVALALLGVLALGLGGALAGSEPLRRQVAQALIGKEVAPPPIRPGGEIRPLRDYSKLTYAAPEPFATREFIARGDFISYSPGTGVVCVKDSSGQVLFLSRGGEPLRSIATLEVAPPSPDPAPPSRVFAATDLQGNLYLSFTARKVVEKRSPEGKILQKLTGFNRPEAIAVDEQGNLYVMDRNILKVLRVREPQTAGPSPSAAGPTPKPKAS